MPGNSTTSLREDNSSLFLHTPGAVSEIQQNQSDSNRPSISEQEFSRGLIANRTMLAAVEQWIAAYSDFDDAVKKLDSKLKKLLQKNSDDQYAKKQSENLETLKQAIKTTQSTIELKAQAIQAFKESSGKCIHEHGGRFKKYRKLITAVITAACAVLGFIAGAIFGTFVGGVLGAPTGPGAVVTATAGAVVAGAKGAVIGAAAGTALASVGGFVGSRFGFFKTEALIDKVANQAGFAVEKEKIKNRFA